eukprot:c13963_g1_i2.p1 GENE.c13963_g1_i2~~c13963_g1_i2.p1  ORF type:complete len:569 (-),score=-30.65 c13963_g1_i2:36-1742(-)
MPSTEIIFAIRLFLIIVGTLFIWEAVPSTRWTYDLSPNIQTGLWKTCSCNKVDRSNCRTEYSELQNSYFKSKYNCTQSNCANEDAYQAEKNNNAQFQYLFKNLKGGVNISNITTFHNHRHGMPKYSPDQWENIWTNSSIYEKDSEKCRQYYGSGAISLITYLFAFFGFLIACLGIAAGKTNFVTIPVILCAIMTGIWGLITTVMFSDLLGKNQDRYPLGHQFSVFTVSWILYFIVGISALIDRNKANPNSTIAAGRAIAFCLALVGFAYGMGNDWFVQDQQALIAPMGGFQWTVKAGSFFIAPAEHAPYITTDSLLEYTLIDGRNFDGDRSKARYCDYSSSDPQYRLINNASSDNLEYLIGNRNHPTGARRSKNYPKISGESRYAETTRNHYNNQCLLSGRPTYVRGEHVIGLFNECQCKKTTSLTCTPFGSYWPMFNGRTQNCNIFNVARALVLLAGLFSILSIITASIMVGDLRRFELHKLSTNFSLLTALVGFIASVLYGAVLFDVDKLAQDFALFLAGWWLVFFGALIALSQDSSFRDGGASKVVPMVAITPQPASDNSQGAAM